jgi:hypothetical protein
VEDIIEKKEKKWAEILETLSHFGAKERLKKIGGKVR